VLLQTKLQHENYTQSWTLMPKDMLLSWNHLVGAVMFCLQ